MKLYEIDQQLQRLLELDTERMVDAETGEILTAEEIDKLQMDRTEKIEGCLLVIKNKAAEAEAIDAEIKRLTERKRILNNKEKWLREYVAQSLAGEKFTTARVAVSYRKSESVEVTCPPNELPENYCKLSYTADKTSLKKALKDGIEIAGVQLVVKLNMQIK